MLLMKLFDWVINNADLRNCGMAVLVKTSIQKHHKAMCRYSAQCFGRTIAYRMGRTGFDEKSFNTVESPTVGKV